MAVNYTYVAPQKPSGAISPIFYGSGYIKNVNPTVSKTGTFVAASAINSSSSILNGANSFTLSTSGIVFQAPTASFAVSGLFNNPPIWNNITNNIGTLGVTIGTYGNNTFVYLASATPSSQAAYSTDGLIWTVITLPLSLTWTQVAFGGGSFVALGTAVTATSSIATSSDGISWQQRTLPIASTSWQSVAYGNGSFVAVSLQSGTSYVASSTDGITWTQRTFPITSTWSTVAYGNGSFVAVAGGSANSNAVSSSDGITWQQRTLPVSTVWEHVVYGGGSFVAIGVGSNAASSTDGITWVRRTMISGWNWSSIHYSNGLDSLGNEVNFSGFIVLNRDSSSVSVYSTDGITWTERLLPATASWSEGVYGNGSFISVTATGTRTAHFSNYPTSILYPYTAYGIWTV